jgi:TolB protein
MNGDGTAVTQLTTTPNVNDSFPAWSPDGSKVAFRRLSNGNFDVYVVNADGSGLQRLTTASSVESYPAWTPDGKQIVFASNRNDPNPTTCTNIEACTYNIFLMHADGSHVRQLSSGSASDIAPAVAPDGNTIAFMSNRGGAEAVWTMTINGTAIHQLTPASMQAGDPDWSPDGTKIVFANNECGPCANSDLFVMDKHGKNVTQLTRSFGNNGEPRWSPDGTKIVFTHVDSAASTYDIYTMNADGTRLTNLTNSPTVTDLAPAWGPGLR